MLKFRYLLLILLLLFKVSALQAKDSSFIKDTIQSIYQFCADAFIKKSRDEHPLLESEQQLREQGYRDEYIAGLDHVRKNLQLAERLRKDKINPFTSHIEEFADLIDPHIEFIKEGIQSQDSDDKEIKLNLLESLKSEAQRHQNLSQVTYRWWFNFNFLLSILATPQLLSHFYLEVVDINDLITNPSIEKTNSFFLRGLKKRSEDIIEAINEFLIDVTYETNTEEKRRFTWERNWYLINAFPKRVLIPTVQPLGIISINETHGTGVHFIGLNKEFKTADRRVMYSDDFFQHDISHFDNIKNIDNLQLTKYIRDKITSLPRLQREILEYVFYNITYEQGYTFGKYMAYTIDIDTAFGIDKESIEEAQASLRKTLNDSPYIFTLLIKEIIYTLQHRLLQRD